MGGSDSLSNSIENCGLSPIVTRVCVCVCWFEFCCACDISFPFFLSFVNNPQRFSFNGGRQTDSPTWREGVTKSSNKQTNKQKKETTERLGQRRSWTRHGLRRRRMVFVTTRSFVHAAWTERSLIAETLSGLLAPPCFPPSHVVSQLFPPLLLLLYSLCFVLLCFRVPVVSGRRRRNTKGKRQKERRQERTEEQTRGRLRAEETTTNNKR